MKTHVRQHKSGSFKTLEDPIIEHNMLRDNWKLTVMMTIARLKKEDIPPELDDFFGSFFPSTSHWSSRSSIE
ncbi:hypothetical protein Celaphus_00014168 [Cervus elaphus hippelaphus]|uniref:Uncharacterized protein n=1 Tax=Cervus elaphus hippelaphus TaxID=46360 RepID=A0A212D4N4_CEREH|nr:hypothetical protein Celaphus_00014168 [Cervus elaphus hippelaphus]